MASEWALKLVSSERIRYSREGNFALFITDENLASLLDRVVKEEREKCAREIEEHFRCCSPKDKPLSPNCMYEAHGIELRKFLLGDDEEEGGSDA